MIYNAQTQKVFLSATWEYLLMINFEVAPEILEKRLPPHTYLDLYNGKALVSVVGFLFNNTRVLNIKWPLHTGFEEVNLRFYVKKFDGKNWKRGVVFVSEIVPKPLIALIANTSYNEHYSIAKMNHELQINDTAIHVAYRWKKPFQQWNTITASAINKQENIQAGSEEEFIFEHYYGYNHFNKNIIVEYEVEHPRWQIYTLIDFNFDCNVAKLYGQDFVPFLQHKKPHSVFFARGSDVIVRTPKYLMN